MTLLLQETATLGPFLSRKRFGLACPGNVLGWHETLHEGKLLVILKIYTLIYFEDTDSKKWLCKPEKFRDFRETPTVFSFQIFQNITSFQRRSNVNKKTLF